MCLFIDICYRKLRFQRHGYQPHKSSFHCLTKHINAEETWLHEITLSLCVSYSYLTRVILFRLSGETESNNYLSFTNTLSTMSSPSPHKNPSHFLCYSASSSYPPTCCVISISMDLPPKISLCLLLICFETSTKTNHVSYTHRSNKVYILLNQWFSSVSSGCTAIRACMNSAKLPCMCKNSIRCSVFFYFFVHITNRERLEISLNRRSYTQLY
jgi:hypothetical protein